MPGMDDARAWKNNLNTNLKKNGDSVILFGQTRCTSARSLHLNDSILKWKFVEIKVKCGDNISETQMISTKDIDYNDYHAFGKYFSDAFNFHCTVYFMSETTAYIRDISGMGWDSGVSIRIVGHEATA